MEITFKENSVTSQQTLLNILKSCKYTFTSIAEGYHTHFYCMIKCEPSKSVVRTYKWFKWMGVPKPKNEIYPIAYDFYDCNEVRHTIPIVFTQDEVTRLIQDAPENYIGTEEL